jgi:hypothetical protein
MTKNEFVEMLTIMSKRCKGDSKVLAYRKAEDVGRPNWDLMGSMLQTAFGRLCVDDDDDPVTREGGKSSTPLYALDEIDTWKPGLFEKLVGYTWWIDPEDEINVLDVMAAE